MKIDSEKPVVWFFNMFGSQNIGGTETATTGWTREFHERGYRVVHWCPDYYESGLENKRLSERIEVCTMPTYQGKGNLRLPCLRAFSEFRQALEKDSPEKVIINGYHSFEMWVPLLAALWREGQINKLVQVIHGDPIAPLPKNVGKFIRFKRGLVMFKSLIVKKALHQPGVLTIAVSEFVANRVKEKGIAQDPIVCYPPVYEDAGCSPRKYETAGKKDRQIQALTVTRISPEKGLFDLVSLAEECQRRDLAVNFRLAGSSSNPDFMRQFLQQSQGKVEIIRLKVGKDLCQTYKTSDICIMPSPNEGLGLVTIESLRHGVPVLAKSIPPTREILQGHQGAAFLVHEVDRRQAVLEGADYLEQVVKNPGMLAEMSCQAIRVGNKFDPLILSQRFATIALIRGNQ